MSGFAGPPTGAYVPSDWLASILAVAEFCSELADLIAVIAGLTGGQS